MKKNHRQGGKFGGNHTTLIDLASELADVAERLPEVTKISPGFINSGTGTGRGERRVKISDAQGGVILTVRQNSSVQELRIITRDPQSTKLVIARESRDRDVAICFGEK